MRKKEIEEIADKTLSQYENQEFLDKMREQYYSDKVSKKSSTKIRMSFAVKSSVCAALVIILCCVLCFSIYTKPKESHSYAGENYDVYKTTYEEINGMLKGYSINPVENAILIKNCSKDAKKKIFTFIVTHYDGLKQLRIIIRVNPPKGNSSDSLYQGSVAEVFGLNINYKERIDDRFGAIKYYCYGLIDSGNYKAYLEYEEIAGLETDKEILKANAFDYFRLFLE